MFILRQITFDGQEWNRMLGDEYSYVDAETNADVFRRGIENSSDPYLAKDPEFYIQSSFGWISDGKNIIVLAKSNEYYIMTSDGKTFKHLRNPYSKQSENTGNGKADLATGLENPR